MRAARRRPPRLPRTSPRTFPPGAALAAALAACALGACARAAPAPVPAPPAPPTSSQAADALPPVLARVREAVDRRRYATADSLLGAFRLRFPGTVASAEVLYWRGLLRLDPENPATSTRDGLADLEAYRSGGALNERVLEATVLRRLVLQADSLRAAIAYERSAAATAPMPAAAAPPSAWRDTVRVRDEELTRMRTELETTRAELERLRRRLAPPRP